MGKNNIAFIINLKALLIRQISLMDLEINIFYSSVCFIHVTKYV